MYSLEAINYRPDIDGLPAVSVMSDENKLLGKHILATALLIPSWVIWSESRYFDDAANKH